MSEKELSKDQKISYALGLDVGQSFKRLPVKMDLDLLTKAIKDIFEGNELMMSQDDFKAVMTEFQTKMQAEGAKLQAKAGEANKAKGTDYLATNKKRTEIKETESGLQYEVIKEGEGNKPTAEDTVSVHYTGTLIDGKEFDSSVSRGTPASFPVKGVIKGWTEALQLMTVGSKYKIHVPADLAYGTNGAGEHIGPESTLVFDIELLEIV